MENKTLKTYTECSKSRCPNPFSKVTISGDLMIWDGGDFRVCGGIFWWNWGRTKIWVGYDYGSQPGSWLHHL